jgi:hypothetical protein
VSHNTDIAASTTIATEYSQNSKAHYHRQTVNLRNNVLKSELFQARQNFGCYPHAPTSPNNFILRPLDNQADTSTAIFSTTHITSTKTREANFYHFHENNNSGTVDRISAKLVWSM